MADGVVDMAPGKPRDGRDHNWSDDLNVSLKEHVESRLGALEKALKVARDDLDVRLEQAREQLERRLEGMNEFRQALRDQNQTFVTKVEHDLVLQRLASLEITRAELSGKASRSSMLFAVAVAVAGLLVSILSFFHKP